MYLHFFDLHDFTKIRRFMTFFFFLNTFIDNNIIRDTILY